MTDPVEQLKKVLVILTAIVYALCALVAVFFLVRDLQQLSTTAEWFLVAVACGGVYSLLNALADYKKTDRRLTLILMVIESASNLVRPHRDAACLSQRRVESKGLAKRLGG